MTRGNVTTNRAKLMSVVGVALCGLALSGFPLRAASFDRSVHATEIGSGAIPRVEQDKAVGETFAALEGRDSRDEAHKACRKPTASGSLP